MKKTGLIIISVFLLTLIGCTKTVNVNKPIQESDEPIIDNVAQTDEFEFITLSKSDKTLQLSGSEGTEFEIIWQHLELSEKDAEKYPELNRRIEEMNNEEDSYGVGTRDEFLSMMEEFPVEGNAWYYYSNTQYEIQRADENIVSVIYDYEGYSGGAHGYYSKTGININPETGKDIPFEDVILDRDAFDKYVYDMLLETNTYEIREENRQSFYQLYRESGYNWSMDYEKLTVYFNPYEIASYAAGLLKVDVMFNEHPELFSEKYINVPENVPLPEHNDDDEASVIK